MTSLREQLEGKERRRVSYRVQVSDPGQDARRVAVAAAALAAAQASEDRAGEVPALQKAHEDALKALETHFVDVWFVALPDADFERLWRKYGRGRDEVDQAAFTVALAAACAEDPELRDEAWWRAQLAEPTWTVGEKDELYNTLFTRLHYSVPSGALGKG